MDEEIQIYDDFSWLDEPVFVPCDGCGCDVGMDKWCDDFEDYYCDRCYDAKVIDNFICDYALECPALYIGHCG